MRGFFRVLLLITAAAGGFASGFSEGVGVWRFDLAEMPPHAMQFELAAEPDYATAKLATMRYQTADAVCSATAIGPHKVLTAKHCIEDGFDGLRLGGRTARVEKVEEDKYDAAILTVDLYFLHWATFGPRPEQGDVVFSHGNPAAVPDILLIGRVAGWVDGYMGIPGVMVLDRNDWFGCSGAAVFDRKGRIVGVVNAVFPWPQKGWRLTAVYPLTFAPEQLK